jgi:hypothetical protein
MSGPGDTPPGPDILARERTMEIIAYQIHPIPEFVLEPASNARAWMDATENRFAYSSPTRPAGSSVAP